MFIYELFIEFILTVSRANPFHYQLLLYYMNQTVSNQITSFG